MRAEIQQAASGLIGQLLWDAGRAADLAWFAFGERRMVQDFRGDPKEVGEFALHVQCAWRIVQNERVVVGHRDLYYPAGAGDKSPEVPADFHWDAQGANRLDERLQQLFKNPPAGMIVKRIEVGLAGGLRLYFENEAVLELFPDDSFDEEHWRLFRPYREEKHFVVQGTNG